MLDIDRDISRALRPIFIKAFEQLNFKHLEFSYHTSDFTVMMFNKKFGYKTISFNNSFVLEKDSFLRYIINDLKNEYKHDCLDYLSIILQTHEDLIVHEIKTTILRSFYIYELKSLDCLTDNFLRDLTDLFILDIFNYYNKLYYEKYKMKTFMIHIDTVNNQIFVIDIHTLKECTDSYLIETVQKDLINCFENKTVFYSLDEKYMMMIDNILSKL